MKKYTEPSRRPVKLYNVKFVWPFLVKKVLTSSGGRVQHAVKARVFKGDNKVLELESCT